MNKFPKRGEIYWVNLDPTIGSEINKIRPVLVISNNIGNEISKRVIVAPITSSIKAVYDFEVKIEIKDKSCKILLDQVRTVDKILLGDRIATLGQNLMEEVEKALRIVLAF